MANAKLDVDIGSFVSNINSAKSVLKGLDAEMKAADATFKATGNSEQQLTSKTKTLNAQIKTQKDIADQAAQAMKAMKDAGVDPMDASYQKLYATMQNAIAGMNNAQAELNGLSQGAAEAAGGADQLSKGLNGISKKISLDQVISGIDRITNGLESAAKKAIQLGEHLWDNIMDSARLSDDILTQAGILDMTPEQYQQYKGVFDTIGEITISEWAAAKRKIQRAMNDPTSDQIDVLSALGFTSQVPGKNGGYEETVSILAENWEDMFWDAAQQLQSMVASGQLTQDLADTYGEALFGKKFSSLKNLIKLGKEGFQEALGKQATISDEALEKNAALNDKVIQLQESFNALKAEVTSGLAPALTDAANALNGLLNNLLEYLKKPEGQAMLEKLGTAVSGLFDDLGEIDPESVVQNFTSVFETLVGGLQWIVDNKDTLIAALEAVVAGWATLKITGGALEVLKIVNGLRDLTSGTVVGQAASGLGNILKGAASIALKAAPWLAGLALLLNPGDTQDNSLVDENGNLTPEASAYGYKKDENGEVYQDNRAIVEAAAQAAWDQYRSGKFDKAAMESLRATILNDNMFSDLTSLFYKASKGSENWKEIEDIDLTEWLKGLETPKIEIDPEAPEGAAGDIAEQIGVVDVPVKFVPVGEPIEGPAYLPRNVGQPWRKQANGIWAVPYDGYLASLHKGERVMPAREVSSRSFSSNLYVENMNMGGGMSADALAATIAARNRRMMAGYGS